MSLKCSLLGHAFDDGEVEREREEQGSEVVITIRETETCTRCGAERVVSENKEVTTLETPSDIVGDDLADAEAEEPAETAESEDEGAPDAASGGPDAAAGAAAAGAAGVTSGGAAEESPSGPNPGSATGEAGAGSTPEPAPASDPDADEDDGVILDADGDAEGERAPGEWPEEDADSADAGADAVPEWPQKDDDGDGDDWAPETDAETPTEVEPTSTAVTVPEGSFHCPECDFSTPVEDSSLRAGDFCPECHRGSLEHRT